MYVYYINGRHGTTIPITHVFKTYATRTQTRVSLLICYAIDYAPPAFNVVVVSLSLYFRWSPGEQMLADTTNWNELNI